MDPLTATSLEQDLELNPFYPLLKNDYLFVFDKSGTNRFTVLLPPAETLIHRSGVQDLLESHIIRSEQIGGRYNTVSGKWVVIADNKIITSDGFEFEHIVQILSEHILTNQRKKSVRILVISEPLIAEEIMKKQAPIVPLTTVFSMLPKKPNMQNYIDFLQSFPENASVLAKMDDYVRDFNENYIMIPGCESQVWKRIKSIWMDSIESLLFANASFYSSRFNMQCLNELHLAVESYLLNGVHDVVYKGLCDIHAAEDRLMEAKIIEFDYVTPLDINIAPEFTCDFTPVIAEFNLVSNCRTPIDKLRSLQSTIKLLTTQIEVHVEQLHLASTEPASPVPFTTDDLLACLVYVILKARPSHIHADLAFMQNFRFSNVHMSELGFNLVTLQAAVAFILYELIVDPRGSGDLPDQIEQQWQGVSIFPQDANADGEDEIVIHEEEKIAEPVSSSTQESEIPSEIPSDTTLANGFPLDMEQSPSTTSFNTPYPTPITPQTPSSSRSPTHPNSRSSSPPQTTNGTSIALVRMSVRNDQRKSQSGHSSDDCN